MGKGLLSSRIPLQHLIMASTSSSSDDDDDDGNQVKLWTREETSLLQVNVGNTVLRLRQYGSDDDRWGIHSCVWDGGLALLDYFSQVQHGGAVADVVLDLGAGTGIVGLGLASIGAAAKRVVLTDLPQAIPLLLENVSLNPCPNTACTLTVHELTWGELELPPWIQTMLSQLSESDKLVVVGADIIYHVCQFEPLLRTLELVLSKCRQRTDAEFWFASQSTRRHLPEFWNLARAKGWTVHHHANVNVSEKSCQHMSTFARLKQDGICHIFQLERCPLKEPVLHT
jgi:predicted nicotinamide N-methyase